MDEMNEKEKNIYAALLNALRWADIEGNTKKEVRSYITRLTKDIPNNYKELTILTVVLNHQCWKYWHDGNGKLSNLYHDLWMEAKNICYNDFNTEEMNSYFSE